LKSSWCEVSETVWIIVDNDERKTEINHTDVSYVVSQSHSSCFMEKDKQAKETNNNPHKYCQRGNFSRKMGSCLSGPGQRVNRPG